jgi:RNA polymerase sigma factor (sigma-70 family)
MVDAEDLASELILWLFEHEQTVERYRTEDYGEPKLFVALRRTASKYCVKEQESRTGSPLFDDDPYTIGQVERALPFIFEEIPQTVLTDFTSQVHPGSHGMALAIITDLRGAFQDMPEQVRETLTLRFRDGLTFTDMGRLTGISGEAAKKRVTRAVRRVRDRLSGADDGVSGAR